MNKQIKIITFPYGLIRSEEAVLMPLNYSDNFYFVSDYWATTQYPKTAEGLKLAEQHIKQDKLITEQIKNTALI